MGLEKKTRNGKHFQAIKEECLQSRIYPNLDGVIIMTTITRNTGTSFTNTKVGAMISSSNMKKVQAVHDFMAELGASCEAVEQETEDKSLSPMKMMKLYEMGGLDYARSEKWDIQSATYALNSILSMSDIDYGEKENVARLVKIARGIVEFINIELNELEQAVVSDVTAKSFAAPKEEMNLSYVKSLGLDKVPDLACKFVAKDQIKGYAILWGDENKVDLEKEYFTKSTNFWDNQPQWLTWDHAQDEEFKSDPRIGTILEVGDDEWGKWYVAKLKKAEAYRKYLDDLIEKKSVGSSSDSAPQYVKRVKTGKSIWLAEWPLFAVSLTDNPCEPRMIGSLEFLKSLGMPLPDVSVTNSRYAHQKRQAELLKLKQYQIK